MPQMLLSMLLRTNRIGCRDVRDVFDVWAKPRAFNNNVGI